MENRGRVLSVDFANAVGRTVKAQPLTAIDYGQILEIHGLPLPPSFECHFSKNGSTAYKSIGTTTNGIGTVPFIDQQTQSGGIITAYIYLHETADDGETEYRIIIPVESRPGVTPAEPTPVQQDVIAQAISALNNAVTTTTENVAITEANKQATQQSAEEAEADANRADTAWNGAVIAQNSAQASADVASTKADEAVQAKNDAIGAKNLAQAHALDAQGSATLAGQKANEADNSADLAQQYMTVSTTKASQASQSEQIATQKATESAQSAQNAENDRILAVQAKNDAETAKTGAETAQGKAEEAQGKAEEAQDNAEDFAESAQASADRAEQEADRWYEFLPVDTASGSLAHFTDGANSVPVKALSVSLEPIQSGSGDPSPNNVRPITGHTQVVVTRTGKNLLNIDKNDSTPTPADVYASPRVMSTEYAYVGMRRDNYYYKNYVSGYSNSNGVIKLTTLNNINYGVGFPVECEPNTTYTLSATLTNGTISAGYYDKDWNYLNNTGLSTSSPLTFTTPSNAKYMVCIFGSTPIGTEGTIKNIQLELGSSASSYEPYSGQSITIPLGDTVYGGTLDVVNGVLTVDKAMVDMGTLNWVYVETGGFYSNVSTAPVNVTDAMCSVYAFDSSANDTTAKKMFDKLEDKQFAWYSNLSRVFVREDAYTVASDFKTAVTGQQLLYELATPITINLTAQQMTTLLGINNIWSDSGDVSVDYRADVQLYIQKMIANALNA